MPHSDLGVPYLLLCLHFMATTHIYIYILQDTQGSITIFVYIPGVFWTIRHLTDTSADVT